MEFFRKIVNGWVGKALLALVIVLFSAYGVESLMVLANQKKPVAEVNGAEISHVTLERSVEFERRSILARMGENPDLSRVSPEVLRPRVLDSLIDRLLMWQTSTDLGAYASDNSITKWIMSFPQFQTDGKFDKALFEGTVQQLGMSPLEFANEIRKDFVVNQLRQGIADTAFVTEQELKRLIELQQQARDFRYVTLAHTTFAKNVQVSDEEVSQYYREHEDQFRRDERAKFQYVELSSQSYEKDIKISDDELNKAYQEYQANQLKQESREAAHILINIDADTTEAQARERLESLIAKLNQGEAFDNLAKEFSEDQGSAAQGGYLGFSERGGDFLPSFDEALFAIANSGGLSPIVKTEYGLHIIKLISIKKPEVKSLDEKKSALITDLKKAKALALYHDAFDDLKSQAFESGDLQPLVEKFKLPLQTTDWIPSTPAHDGLFANDRVLKTAFSDSLREGYNSEAIEVESGKAVVLRQSAYEPSQLRALADVKSTIVELLTAEKAQAAAEKAGRDLIAKVRSGEQIPLTLNDQPLTWIKHEKMTRASGGAPPAVLNKVFAMPNPAVISTKSSNGSKPVDSKSVETKSVESKSVEVNAAEVKPVVASELTQHSVVVIDGISNANDFILIELLLVTPGKFDLKPEESLQMQAYLSSQLGRLSFEDFFSLHQKQAEIVRR
jgi:peptidyl-prolyl cis-trans isomerase D